MEQAVGPLTNSSHFQESGKKIAQLSKDFLLRSEQCVGYCLWIQEAEVLQRYKEPYVESLKEASAPPGP